MNQNQIAQKRLTEMMVVRGVGALLTFMAIFFLPGGTFNYWQAWVTITMIFIPMICVIFYFVKYDPEFLNHSMKFKEKEVEQKLIVRLSFIPLIISFLLPGFDKRFGGSHISPVLVIAAEILVWFTVVSGGFILLFIVGESRFPH